MKTFEGIVSIIIQTVNITKAILYSKIRQEIILCWKNLLMNPHRVTIRPQALQEPKRNQDEASVPQHL